MLAILSQMGLGSLGQEGVYSGGSFTATVSGYYDGNGNYKMDDYYNLANEFGIMKVQDDGELYWLNATNAYSAHAYQNVNPASTSKLYMLFHLSENEGFEERASDWRLHADITGGQYGVLAVMIGVIIASAVVGVRIVGSGIGEFSASVIIIGGVLVSIWAFFSFIAYGLLFTIPLSLGVLFYFAISLLYTVGIIQLLGSG